ncbi:hypothetical protein CBI38_34120 (plasmid) [Rhodococcus oxybenzonivorans]|uniref:Uncharacterized protein n=1 Tax=Rhodococcus oxybenzonivorans TaxID=1990687 RepID=A0A2S2C6H5_9NOCA|nr:hypothetical protein [Rhodococcus oxybenzonivorans]AWK76442.1 hypothetical protein CBI38_34120 [Rhodococcus oxybenzonivorans]
MAPTNLDEHDGVPAILREQLTSLLTRHTLDDVVLVRVLIEHYNEIAATANRGDTRRARRDYQSLSERVPLPDSHEIKVILDSFALPVSALIYWRDGRNRLAREELVGSLEACADLVASYGHTFVTCRQLHLANNYVRVLVSEGKTGEAASLTTALRLVISGDTARWPFVGAETLVLPLVGDWRDAIEMQLLKLEHQLQMTPH